jgi:biotin-dependent carboxylase-like uncharacterized protein
MRPAVQTTVQDLGRRGSRHLGVGACGAMDRLALMIGNALVGNADDAAALELCLPPAVIRFDATCFIALTGPDCAARLGGATLREGRAVVAEAGMTLELSSTTRGARAYLCIAGGIDVPLVMGSRSTDLQTQMGGFEGRLIRRGDVLQVRPADTPPKPASIALPPIDGPIRVMAGPEFQEFGPEAHAALFEANWKVTPQSNRMGFRLDGPVLSRVTDRELKSHAVFPGVIQVPKGGAPIVLMADAHTTGGYPRIATVIAADQWRLAQAPPGGSIRFSACTRTAAAVAWQRQQTYLQGIRSSLHAH